MTLLLTDQRFARSVRETLLPGHFLDNQNRIMAEHCLAYLGKYRSLIDPKVLVGDFLKEDKRVPSVELRDYVAKLHQHLIRVVADGTYVRDKLVDWMRNQTLLQLAIDLPRLIAAGKVEDADRRWKRAIAIGEGQSEEEFEFFSTASVRAERRKLIKSGALKRGVPTGWPEIDKHINAGGWQRRALTIIMAGTKRGKTMFMLQSALLSAALFGSNCLYISLEVDEDLAGDRLDAAFTGTPIDELIDDIEATKDAVELFAKGSPHGNLWFVRRPTNSLTPAGLEAIIERHLELGRPLDAIFVDYMGIMKTRPEHRYDDLGYIAKELRRIGDVYDAAVITGYQTNRDGMGRSVAGADSAGDSFQPMQDCDLMLSINADEAELRADVRRIHWALTRGEPQITLKVQGDLSKGRLIESIIEKIL